MQLVAAKRSGVLCIPSRTRKHESGDLGSTAEITAHGSTPAIQCGIGMEACVHSRRMSVDNKLEKDWRLNYIKAALTSSGLEHKA